MAAIRPNSVSPGDGHRDRLFPHYKMTSSYQSRSSGGHQESKRIMSVLQDWTEANQKSRPHQGSLSTTPQVKVDRVGTQGMLNQDAYPTSPRCERRMTPDLIRVSPQQQMTYQGEKISRGPALFMTTRPLSAEVPKSTPVNNEIYQQSMSDDYNIQRTFERDQSRGSHMPGKNFSNPTYSRVNSPAPSEGGDFYSKENIRSVSQMLLLTSPETKSTPSQNSFSEHRIKDRSIIVNKVSSSSISNHENSSLFSTRGDYNSNDKFLSGNDSGSNHNSHMCVANQVFSVSNKSPYSYSENTCRPNLESSPKVPKSSQVNDSLLSSPKFKALRIANSSDSTQSSPQIPRKLTPSPFKSSFCTDGESKNSLDSSTLSIATSWSSGVGIPFPQSRSSTSLSTPSPTQKIHSTSTENFRRRGSSTVEEENGRNNDDMFPWLVSNVAKPKEHLSVSVQYISQSAGKFNSEGKLATEIENSISSNQSRNRHGYQSGTLGGSSYIYPPQYPSIPRAKPREDSDYDLSGKSLRQADDKTHFPQHSCCNCSCHEELAPSWKANGVRAPFPLLLYDQNQNIVDLNHISQRQDLGNVQTLHPVNRIHYYSEDVHGLKTKRGDAYKVKGTHISDREEYSVSCNGYSTPVCTQAKYFPSHSTSTSFAKSSQEYDDHNNVSESRDGLGFHFEGNHTIDSFPTIAHDKTLQSDLISFGRKSWNAKEKAYPSELFPAQKQQNELSDKSSRCATLANSEMRNALGNSSSLSREISPTLKNSSRSPPKSPNRMPPPLPTRDLSITISNKTKRSPLSLPPYTSDFSLQNASPRDDGGYDSHDLTWWKKIDRDLYSPRRDGWKENQGINGDTVQTFRKESDLCIQGRGCVTDTPPKVGNKIDVEQDNDWGNQQAEDLNAWKDVKGVESKNIRAESHVNESGDSFRKKGLFDPTEGVTEYENVALIDIDKLTRVSGSYKELTTEVQKNGEHKSQEELYPLQSDKTINKKMGGHVKSIISKLESKGAKMPSLWGPVGLSCRQDQTFPGSYYQYPEGTRLSMLPSSHPVSGVPQQNSSYDAMSYRTMQNSVKSSTSGSQHFVGNREKDSMISHSVLVASSPKSWNGVPERFDKQGYHSTSGVGSMGGADSVHPGGRYHQPDVIPIAAPTSQSHGEEDSTMCIVKDDDVHYQRDQQRGANPQTRAPPPGVKGPMEQWVQSSVLQLNLTESNSVQQWLFDLRTSTDCESMCILQGKSIHTSPVNLEVTANTIKENVLRLKTTSKCLSAKFGQLHGKLSDRSEDILESCSEICIEIHCIVKECEGFFLEIPSNLFSQQQSLMQEVTQFKRLIKELESDVHGELQPESHLTDQLLELGEQCGVFVEAVQTKLIQALVYSVQDSASELNIMVSVKTVHSLITDYPSIKPILLQEQVISALFQVCLQTSFAVNSVQLLSLQTIAKFCQDTEGRIETEKIGGIGHLSQIISSPTSSESLKIEAAALISQLTSPEVVSDFRQSRFHQHLEVLLKALTDLMEQSRDSLVFLVASSAVANITFMGSGVFEFLAQDNAAKILVESWKDGKVESLNIKDQIVTIFANMAEDQACRESIKQCEGIPLLIELLQTQIATVGTDDENQDSDEVIRDVKICEQIQQKSAIALARLSKDKTCAAEIEHLEGISIFSRICRTASYRNKSVPVLIACLAALRRLHHALGPSFFPTDDINNLVRPKMIESIFACSSMSEESFV